VEVKILTGVLHQVRAHLAAIGAPVVGDALYGGRALKGLQRFFLHARFLGLSLPETHAAVHVESPLPAELRRVLLDNGLKLPGLSEPD
jgi:23S rRNA pseudouridine1911/1915/1917 synthase